MSCLRSHGVKWLSVGTLLVVGTAIVVLGITVLGTPLAVCMAYCNSPVPPSWEQPQIVGYIYIVIGASLMVLGLSFALLVRHTLRSRIKLAVALVLVQFALASIYFEIAGITVYAGIGGWVNIGIFGFGSLDLLVLVIGVLISQIIIKITASGRRASKPVELSSQVS